MLDGTNKLQLNSKTMKEALQYYLNNAVFKDNGVQVTNIEQTGKTGNQFKDPQEFIVTIYRKESPDLPNQKPAEPKEDQPFYGKQ